MQAFKNEKINKFIFCEYIICAIIILSTLLMKSEVSSIFFSVSFIVLFVETVFISCRAEEKKNFNLSVLIIALSAFCILFSSVLLEAQITFEYLKEYFVFAATILLLYVSSNVIVNNKTVNFILKFNIIIAALYPIAYNFFSQENYFTDLSLNFTNPNLAGMWILQSVLYSFLGVLLLKHFIWKLASAFLIAYNVYLINLTAARNCIITLALFILMLVWAMFKPSPKLPKWILVVVNIVPICFVPMYLYLLDWIKEKGWLSFMVSKGKPLDSRVEIWNDIIDKLNGHWIMGVYPESAGNSHNSHLVILASYGFMVLLLVIIMMLSICLDINKRIVSKKQTYALIAFFAALFMGFGEGALFAGGQGIYIMILGFVFLANGSYEDSVKKIETAN